jgi:undecaprenyl-diphosphatase
MLILQAIVLGIIQGLTEFIPISSSAHLIIVPWLFGWSGPALTSLTFDMALHVGTLLAILVFFAKDWWLLLQAFFFSIKERKMGEDTNRRLVWLLIIATIPGGIAGILFESKVEKLFHQPNVPITASAMVAMAAIIATMGLLLFLADELVKHTRELKALTFKDALLLGLAQALAVFPGVSRSGSVISAGLALKLKREAAAKFSFMLSAPIIAGAGLKSLWEVLGQFKDGILSSSDLALFPVGVLFAAVSGFLCIKFLLNFLQKNSTRVFVFYRWGLAALIVVVALVRPG